MTSLLDELLASYDVNEIHAIHADAPSEATLSAVGGDPPRPSNRALTLPGTVTKQCLAP